MWRNLRVALLLAAATTACYFGKSLEDVPAARSGYGQVAGITTQNGALYAAELLAVPDSGLIVLIADHVTFFPWIAIRRATFRYPDVQVRDGRAPDVLKLEQLRLVSRFPQGLRPALEQRLLAAYRQDSVTVVRR